MKRFWVRFFVRDPDHDQAFRNPPFHWWVSGFQCSWDENKEDTEVICALIDAKSERSAKTLIRTNFYKPEIDSVDEKTTDWLPGDRFPLYKRRLSKTKTV